MIYLQISTAQGPAECRIFARFVLGRLLAEAKAEGVETEIISETADKHGMMSAVLKLDGKHAETLAQRWQGSLQWICASPVRPKHPRKNWYIGIFRLPEKPEMPSESEIEFQTCRSGGKGGQHVNKQSRPSAPHTKPAVFLCASKANAASMPTKNARWNFWHTNWPNIKPHKMPTMPNSSTAVCIR